jgi:cob(I)alamin adenosyltransferase
VSDSDIGTELSHEKRIRAQLTALLQRSDDEVRNVHFGMRPAFTDFCLEIALSQSTIKDKEIARLLKDCERLRNVLMECGAERNAALQKLRTISDEHECELMGVAEARELQVNH